MTRAELRTETRQLVQEPTAKKFTDAMLNSWLDRSVEKVWASLVFGIRDGYGVEESSSDTSIVSGTSRYAWPDKSSRKMIRLERVERVGASISYPYDLIEIAKDERHEYTSAASSDYPRVYYPEAPYIVLVPTPTASIASALRFHGTWEHGYFSGDSASPSFPTRYHYLVAYRAAMMALHLDESSGEWVAQEYARGVLDMIGEMQPDRPIYIRDTSDNI
jgi:hypothetical protein